MLPLPVEEIHGLLRCIILFEKPCIYEVRLNLIKWLDVAISLLFPALVIFKALVQTGSHNPMFLKP